MGSAVMGRFSRTFPPQLQSQHMISGNVIKLLKQIFLVKFILISNYLPDIGKSHLPPRSSSNISYFLLE